MQEKDAQYWMDLLLEKIDDKDLRNWVASIIWWDENPSEEHENNRYMSVVLRQEWYIFKKYFVDKYNNDNRLTAEDLQRGMDLVGYKPKAGHSMKEINELNTYKWNTKKKLDIDPRMRWA